ncbi:hypothetical protein [Carnobacterium maltaromaticum]|uniref:hypothetical protein n=1 Tax=Carnobacterium maltaromaticum TaxID=2751 RepID=UPI0039BDDCD4
MYPIGTYDRFIQKIKGREGKENETSIFGVVLADIRQPDTKSYILNYLDRFHLSSGKYIDFYIPGYFEEADEVYGVEYLELQKEKYVFSYKAYDEFTAKFVKDFGLKGKGVPVLYLIEWDHGAFEKSKIMEFDLDGGENSVKRTVELFELLFSFTRDKEDLLGINNRLELEKLGNYLTSDLIDDLGIPLLTVGKNIGKIILRFKMR